MIELNLSYEAEDYGRRKKKQRDRDGLADHFEKDGRDKRWTGLAVEYELHGYLRDSDVPHVWNDDSLAGLADFEFGAPELDAEGRLQVALKANNGDGPRDDFVFLMPFRSANQVKDGVLLAIVNTPTRRVWIAGYLSRDRFLKLARQRRKGEESFVPGRPLASACWTIRADQLEPAETFFELMRRT